MIRSFLLLQTFLMIGVCASLVQGEPGENLARGKPYTLTPRPNYRLCTDPGDATQLTDGIYTQGYFWTQKSTVGWQHAHPAIITLDLGSVQPIQGVSLNTAAGTAGVEWPSIFLFVSDDGKTHTYLGELTGLSAEHGSPPVEDYAIHRFWTDRLRARGRYVTLVVTGNGPYIFVDEVEVYRGPDAFTSASPSGQYTDDPKAFFAHQEVVQQVKRRLRRDLAGVRRLVEGLPERDALARQLTDIETEIGNLEEVPTEGFRTILPLNDPHRRIFAIQAAMWRAKGLERLIPWQKNRWDMLSPTEMPQRGGVQINVAMMRNETRSAAFNLSNAGSGERTVSLSIVGLPGSPNPDYITVHEVPFTDTRSGIPVAAALPIIREEGGGFPLTIPEGMTRQVWLSFHLPREMPPGEYRGRIVIASDVHDIPIRLRLYPLVFPDRPRLHLGGWDYTDGEATYDVTPANRDALIRHLREHYVDTPWARSSVMPRGKYDDGGNLIEPPSTASFRRWLDRWPNARNYNVFLSVGSHFAGFEMGGPPFRNAVNQWISWWVESLAEWGIQPEQLNLLLVDEPNNRGQDAIIIEYARVIQQAQPEVIVWEDPTWREPWQATPELFQLSDVLCPNMVMWIQEGERFADFYVAQRNAGRKLWFYACSGPGKLLDPYAYHRMQPWFAWKYGAEGIGYWAFGDSNGASSWNEYLTQRGAFTPLFLDERSVTPGKHMEAICEGIGDVEYLYLLRDRIAELERSGKTGPTLDSARELLDSAADRVIACMEDAGLIRWQAPKDRSVADTVRVEVLEMLGQLSLEEM